MQRHAKSSHRLLQHNAVSLICDVLKKAHGPRAAAASLLEEITSCAAREVLAWVQARSEFARVELFILQLLEIIRLARVTSTTSHYETSTTPGIVTITISDINNSGTLSQTFIDKSDTTSQISQILKSLVQSLRY